MEKVSVIIPTFNRFKYLLNTIDSIKNQTYKNIEIIIVNDCSTQKEYYDHKWDNNFIVINLPENTKDKFGYPCVGYVINQGLKVFTGDYFATCDDDDIWETRKLEIQINALKNSNCKMCCTNGYLGFGIYNPRNKYPIYNDYFFKSIREKHRQKGSIMMETGFPKIWNKKFIEIHNSIIACSVLIHKDIIKKIGFQKEIKMGGDIIDNKEIHIDYDYWLRALDYTNCLYINNICIYYDMGHGGGQQF